MVRVLLIETALVRRIFRPLSGVANSMVSPLAALATVLRRVPAPPSSKAEVTVRMAAEEEDADVCRHREGSVIMADRIGGLSLVYCAFFRQVLR
jgi:hypothetical protein